MQAQPIVDALRRYAFRPGEEVDTSRLDDGRLTLFTTRQQLYEGEPAQWRIRHEPWVRDALRVVRASTMENFVATYGLVVTQDGGVLCVNDVATMRELGRRLAGGLDPVAYAQLLAEFYSGREIDGPVVHSFAASYGFQPGSLIEDPVAFGREYPFVDGSVLAPVRVTATAEATTIEFTSYQYYLVEIGGAIDIYRWTVTATPGQPASWLRQRVAERLALPLPKA